MNDDTTNQLNERLQKIPQFLTGEMLIDQLTRLPDYDIDICKKSRAERIIALSDIYQIHIPSGMDVEIYSKLYLSMLHSMKQKKTKAAVRQRIENYRRIQGKESDGVIGGSDSFTIIGPSGIGKSSAIYNSIRVIGDNQPIPLSEPYTQVIPFLVCQCPHDCSVKGLLLEILRQIDIVIGSDYYKESLRRSHTVDILIGVVSQVTLNHIGVLIVDEIQNVTNHKNGNQFIAMLTQLINCSGVSICMIGTPESSDFFEAKMQLARRTLGLKYSVMPYNEHFIQFCQILFQYQYTSNDTKLDDSIIEWLYEHSAGLVSMVVSLVHDAQEIGILYGKEALCLDTLRDAYLQRMKMMQGHIDRAIIKRGQTSVTSSSKYTSIRKESQMNDLGIYKMLMECKRRKEPPLHKLRKLIPVEEVKI